MNLSIGCATIVSMRVLTCTIALTLVLVLFIGGEHPAAASLFAPPWDKVAHIGLYFSLFLLFHLGYPRNTWRIALLVILIGVADEIHQISIPGRHPGWDDVVADCVGVLLAVGFRQVFAARN